MIAGDAAVRVTVAAGGGGMKIVEASGRAGRVRGEGEVVGGVGGF